MLWLVHDVLCDILGCDTTSLDTLLADNSPYCSSLNDTLCTIERLNISYNYCYINSYDEIMALAYCEHGYRPEMFACGSSGTWIAQPITCKKIIDDTTRDETLTVTEPESRSTQDEGTGKCCLYYRISREHELPPPPPNSILTASVYLRLG